MKRIILYLVLLGCGMSAYCSGDVWTVVDSRYEYGDYEGLKSILDTVKLSKNRDVVLKYYWLGQYYYWLSYEDRAKTDSAEFCFNRSIQFAKEHRVSDEAYGYSYLHLAELKYLCGNYDKAIEYLNLAIKTKPYSEYLNPRFNKSPKNKSKNEIGEPSPICKGLGMCYAMKERYDSAMFYLDRCKQGYSGALSVDRMRAKVLAMMGKYEESYKYYNVFVDSIRKEVKDTFLNETLDKPTKEKWWMRVRPFIMDCWRLEGNGCELLYDVALLTKGILLQEDSAALSYKHSDVRKALNDDEVAIEWMVYERGGERRLGAVVMHKRGELSFVETGKTSVINEWVYDEDDIYRDTANVSTIWSQAMLYAIGDAKKIYFAPDGVLNQIGIEYMFQDTTKSLYRLSSTRELIRRRSVRRNTSMAVMGGVNYDAQLRDTIPAENDEEAYKHLKRLRIHASKLLYSKPECDSVIAIRGTQGDTLVLGPDATERNFRALAGRYDKLLLSTHGYCRATQIFESSDFPRRETVDRSMSESGLLFGGFNTEISKRSCVLDGIVSARELAAIDMSRVDLCVISACDGAKGHVSADGTYGIQRGLKAAGVGAMVLSLWAVSDEATRLFMQYFYGAMAEGKDVHTAFWQARERLRNYEKPVWTFDPAMLCNVPSDKMVRCYDKPYYYNSFILIDVI